MQLSRLHIRTLLIPGLSVLLIALLFSCRAYRSAYISERGVHYFQRINLGGVRQSVMIRGHDKDNPVMLFLHGGPGFPLFPVDQASGVMRELESHFTMVYWEQRGTGGSFNWRLPVKSLSVDDFVADTHELVEYVCALLDKEKLFIWGHSWGSNVGAKYAATHPDRLYAYVSTGQSVNPFLNERLCYEYVLREAAERDDRRALRQMERVDTLPRNYSLRDALLVRRWVYNYGGVVREVDPMDRYIDLAYVLRTLTAPEYGLPDKLNMVLMPYFSAEELWEDLKELNLEDSVPSIGVPVYFLLGRHDVVVSAELAAAYFEVLEAPAGKTLIWFEESAHRPHHEETDRFLRVMREQIRPHASP